MSDQNQEIVEFYSAVKPHGEMQPIKLRVLRDDADKWGTEGWYAINRGQAGFGKKFPGEDRPRLLHRLIMGAGPNDLVKFHDGDNTNMVRSNMYIVAQGNKTPQKVVRRGPNGSDQDGGFDDESGDDMETFTQRTVSPFSRKAKAMPAREQVASAPSWGKGLLPVASQHLPEMNVITTIDHRKDDPSNNSIDVVMGFQQLNEQTRRMEWYTVSVDGNEADQLRTYLQSYVNADAMQASEELIDLRHQVATLQAEQAKMQVLLDKANSDVLVYKKRAKDAEKQLNALRKVMAPVLADEAA